MTSAAIRVLLVEDNPADARLVTELLRESDTDFDVTHVTRLEDGLREANASPFNVVLLDLSLPDSEGLATVRSAHAACPDTAIVVMTGQTDQRLANEALQSGAQDYLVKGSTDPSLLERSIRYAISRSKTMLALRESETRYALAVEGARDGLWDWSLDSDEIYYSPRWKSMLGYEDGEILGTPSEWFSRIHPDEILEVRREFDAHIEGRTECFESQYRMRRTDGSYAWVLCRGLAVRDEDGRAYRVAGSQSDITKQKEAEQQLRYHALHDELTGLANRTLFLDRVGQAILRRRKGDPDPVAVLYIGLDRFKVVNESMGHDFGDKMLETIGRRLTEYVRREDTLARIGGDEFAMLIEDIGDIHEAIRLAERLAQLVAIPFTHEGQTVFTSASVGIASSASGYTRAADCLRDAQIAMQRAKAASGAGPIVFDTDMHDRVLARLQLETEVRAAIDRREFTPHYQPIISLRTGETAGFEALLRWQHPERGLLPPSEFLSLTEQLGLLQPIFQTIMPEILTQLGTWQASYPRDPALFVNVNLSRSQFATHDLVQRIETALRENPILPNTLGMEITESMVMEDSERARNVLLDLRARQIRLHLDDFGTGYSSLSCLHLLPFDALKIDRSFIEGITDPDRFEIVRAIVQLGRSLGLAVTAEGIETREQLEHVKRLDCDYAQGYYLARPDTADAISSFLSENGVASGD